MRRIALATLLLLAATAAPAHAAPVCGPAKAKTMAAGKLTRVYVHRKEGPVYACTRGERKRRHLGPTYCYGSSSGCSTLTHAVVAGRFVAYAIQDCCDSYGDAYFSLSIRNVATGKLRERHQFGDPGDVVAWIDTIVLRPTGAAAWLWKRHDFRKPRPNESWVVTRSRGCGEPVTLADSPAITKLWRDGSRAVWRENGADRSAPLC